MDINIEKALDRKQDLEKLKANIEWELEVLEYYISGMSHTSE